ncbi:DNA polymerase III, chi subunit [Pseudogulbenkiania subflava DSM 22618]|uniref:DNA polymerase III, chi subunit n=2 Tax=Pseudogulbenkiania subflava TaxID=451637 RepID=A0A1Y6C5R6_9NEIS|nr:DNA polymerase III, chi subunit [Pseudogulbenkiania subflava DSM 22618]
MPRIDFYTNVADPQAFACRLAQTVFRKGERLLVWLADEGQLAGFSARLWSIADTQFVPHCQLDAGEAPETPIWLTTRLPADLEHPVLLNLGPALPEHPEHFARILEIVGCDEASLATARERFRFYRAAAYEIEHHDMSHL